MKPTVCLCMIVKNEAKVIRRCIDSVLPFITTWSICDTGSTDGTQEIVREHLRHLPGELHERPWVDQQHNRNESIELARPRADYLLLLDADETIETDDSFDLALGEDCYDFVVRMDGLDCEFLRPILVRSRFPWQWRGKRHPGLYGEGAKNPGIMRGIYVRSRTDGASWSDPAKYVQHVRDMQAEVLADPDNRRTRYYLAQSYRDSGMLEMALGEYTVAASLGGAWPEFKWSALYESAKLKERLGRSMQEVVGTYLQAIELREHRAEPLYHAARYLRGRGLAPVALAFAREAAALPKPDSERLFVEPSIYEWRALDELVLCAYFAGELEDARDAIIKLRKRNAPEAMSARFTRNARVLG